MDSATFGIRKIVGGRPIKDDRLTILAARAVRAVDAVRRAVHRVADCAAQNERGDGDASADNGENERIFGRGSARLVFDHLDEIRHVLFLPSVCTRARRGTRLCA